MSCCICQVFAESVVSSLGIGCPRWRNNSADPLLGFRVEFRSASVNRRKGSALWCPHVGLAVLLPSMQKKFVCVAPVPHIPKVPYVFGSRESLLRRLLLY